MSRVTTASSQASTRTTLHVPYTLNQHKQVSKLVSHASVEDFDILKNDSGRNVCIQCSVGYYEAVVKPVIASISTEFTQDTQGVSIRCTVARETKDQRCSISGLFLRFEISRPNIHPDPAPLSIHLHNTQRKLQIQGGGLMHDGSKVAEWFTDNILKELFARQASGQGDQIHKINNIVANKGATELSGNESHSYCNHCKKKFSFNSRPVSCVKCRMQKHSTKCFPCPATTLSPGHAIPSPTLSLSSRPSDTPAAPLISARLVSTTTTTSSLPERPIITSILQDTLTHTSVSMPVQPSIVYTHSSLSDDATQSRPTSNLSNNDSQHPVVSIGVTHQPQNNIQMSGSTALDPTVSPFIPISGPGCSTSRHPKANKQKGKSKPGVGTSKEDIAHEFTLIQVNTLRAKLKTLETKTKDLEFQNTLLLERVAAFEQAEKDAIYEKYFPKATPSTINAETSCHPTHQYTHAHCCHKLPQCCSPPHCRLSQVQCRESPPRGRHEDLLKSIADLKSDLTMVKTLLNTMNSHPAISTPAPNNQHDFQPGSDKGVASSINDQDMSTSTIISLDENVPDLSQEENLNCLDLTSQLQELMHRNQDSSQL